MSKKQEKLICVICQEFFDKKTQKNERELSEEEREIQFGKFAISGACICSACEKQLQFSQKFDDEKIIELLNGVNVEEDLVKHWNTIWCPYCRKLVFARQFEDEGRYIDDIGSYCQHAVVDVDQYERAFDALVPEAKEIGDFVGKIQRDRNLNMDLVDVLNKLKYKYKLNVDYETTLLCDTNQDFVVIFVNDPVGQNLTQISQKIKEICEE